MIHDPVDHTVAGGPSEERRLAGAENVPRRNSRLEGCLHGIISLIQAEGRGGIRLDSQVVAYEVDPQTTVQFEVEPVDGFSPVSSDASAGRIRDAVQPAIEGARAVIDRVAELCPSELQVKFGIKVTGSANWMIAKAATEANFEVTMTWRPEKLSDEGIASQ